MSYKVTKPLVITKNENGSDLYLYFDAVLPSFVSDKEVKRLLDGGFIEKSGDEPAKAPAKKSD